MALDKFAEAWDDKYPQISKSWRTHWENLNTFFGYPPDIRKAIYTTNAIESVNSVIRAAIKKRKVFRQTTQCGRLFIWRSRMHQKNGVCRSRTGG
ncbi:transposase, Mutator family protein [Yersinia pestis 1413]|nr:transposase, Mutator family protein [Yersinia pestis 1413]